MFRLKIFMLAGIILGLSAHFSWADSIDQVVLQPGNPMSVEVNGTLSGCSARTMTSLTTPVDSKYIIQLFFSDPQPEVESCDGDSMFFSQIFTLEENREYSEIIVLLYTEPDDQTPDDQTTVLQDSEILTFDVTSVDVTSVTCSPETLNINAKGNWVTCVLNLYDGNTLEDINVSSIYLDGTIPAEKAVIEDDTMTLKFSRQGLIADITADDTVVFPMMSTLTVSGALVDGTTFEATDTIRVIDPPAKNQKKNKIKVKAKK
ncbi:MAG: hypothetical protein MUO63_17080 [Desulfobulbaceae bacterium]|nr:hypothetical protein [Desulfobulbaceae bacterium]